MNRLHRPVSIGLALLVAVTLLGITDAEPSHGATRAAPSGGATQATVVGSQGTDTALPLTSSAYTINTTQALGSSSNFKGISITVNQTKDLVNQAISITWSGAPATVRSTGQFIADYFQVMECWGDPDTTNAADPGPPPTQCQFGGQPRSPSAEPTPVGSYAYTRIVTQPNWTDYNSTYSKTLPVDSSGYRWLPFHGVDGTVVPISANLAAESGATSSDGNFWLNPLFDNATSNEDDFVPSYPDGTGSELFQVDTGLEAPGLGCGQQSETAANGTSVTPKCWLVLVPRGTSAQENQVEGPGLNTGPTAEVDTSPLSPESWVNRVSIPLQFDPIGTSCPIGANETQVVGGEVASTAITNWQPALCAVPGSQPYSYSPISEDQARSQLATGAGAGMAVVTRPLDSLTITGRSPTVYAPTTLSGAVVGFTVERYPDSNNGLGTPNDPAENALSGVRVHTINLTPRLVAKLLTESYIAQLPSLGAGPRSIFTQPQFAKYQWAANNPFLLTADPEFVKYNPEFVDLYDNGNQDGYNGADAGGLVVEESNSDLTYELWQWVLADPEARAWLSGFADPWGMKVNPNYNITAKGNPTGLPFAASVPENFPKLDRQCQTFPDELIAGPPPAPPRPLCATDIQPYAISLAAAAQDTRAGNDGAKTVFQPAATSPDLAYGADPVQASGQRFILSITDSASAARYGLQTASLSPAGNDSDTRPFIAPTLASLLAGEAAMRPSPVGGVLAANPGSTVSGAYPLPMLTYAAVEPLTLTATQRAQYAAFIRYAAGPGQVPGTSFGQLPAGYVPLPASLRSEAASAATTVLTEKAPVTPTTTSAPPTTQPVVATTLAPQAQAPAPAPTSSGYSSPVETPAAATAASPTSAAPTLKATTNPTEPTTAALTPEALGPTTPAAKTTALTPGSARFVLAVLLGAMVAALAWLGLYRVRRRPQR